MKLYKGLIIFFIVASIGLFFIPIPNSVRTGFLGQGYFGGLGYIVFLYCIISTILRGMILHKLENKDRNNNTKPKDK